MHGRGCWLLNLLPRRLLLKTRADGHPWSTMRMHFRPEARAPDARPAVIRDYRRTETGLDVRSYSQGSYSALQGVGPALHAEHHALQLIYLFNGIGGTVLAVLLVRSKMIPRWVAVLRLIGYTVLLVGTVLATFGATDVTQGAGLLAVVPGPLSELILPIWLVTRGRSGRRLNARSLSPAPRAGCCPPDRGTRTWAEPGLRSG